MGEGPEEAATGTDCWGQDGQCHESVMPLGPTFQEIQLPVGPASSGVQRSETGKHRCVQLTGAGRQVPAV